MPSYRFWSMDSQIQRIRSEKDLRLINVKQSVTSEEALESAVNRLIIELGETCAIERQAIVKPEPNARQKILRSMGHL